MLLASEAISRRNVAAIEPDRIQTRARFQDELRVTSGRFTHAFHAKLTRAGSGVRSTNSESNAGALVPQICPARAVLTQADYHR